MEGYLKLPKRNLLGKKLKVEGRLIHRDLYGRIRYLWQGVNWKTKRKALIDLFNSGGADWRTDHSYRIAALLIINSFYLNFVNTRTCEEDNKLYESENINFSWPQKVWTLKHSFLKAATFLLKSFYAVKSLCLIIYSVVE